MLPPVPRGKRGIQRDQDHQPALIFPGSPRRIPRRPADASAPATTVFFQRTPLFYHGFTRRQLKEAHKLSTSVGARAAKAITAPALAETGAPTAMFTGLRRARSEEDAPGRRSFPRAGNTPPTGSGSVWGAEHCSA